MEQTNINKLLTEQKNDRTQHLDQMNIAEIVDLMSSEDETVAHSVRKALPQISAAIEKIAAVLQAGGRLIYIGAGTSGRLGILDASECPPTFGVSPDFVQGIIAGGDHAIRHAIENAEDDAEAGHRDALAAVTAKDAVVGITASGRTPYVIAAIEAARQLGAVTASISCNSNTPLSDAAEYPIEVPVGPEIITGSTRLKAGTAQKMVLNMISTVSMIQLGKVYGNLMVNVQATNYKLQQRVVNIVMEATGTDRLTAAHYCEQADGDARAAILMLRYSINKEEADAVLSRTRGHFGHAEQMLAADRQAEDRTSS
ncbi:N-acetylmuramic acid 6-phosphate etherase [Paenibacillus sp. GCM10027626]|uniref:N-acetylmuramic acid 6-phosphate etherase n=1 Tax=Paenibacillus sp. GCM10027626 TaxID=3273411 RepID=UPI003632C0FD